MNMFTEWKKYWTPYKHWTFKLKAGQATTLHLAINKFNFDPRHYLVSGLSAITSSLATQKGFTRVMLIRAIPKLQSAVSTQYSSGDYQQYTSIQITGKIRAGVSFSMLPDHRLRTKHIEALEYVSYGSTQQIGRHASTNIIAAHAATGSGPQTAQTNTSLAPGP